MTGIPQSEHSKEKLGDFMTTPVISIDVKASVQEAAHLMDTENSSAILTTENRDHVGISRKGILHARWLGAGFRYPLPYPRS